MKKELIVYCEYTQDGPQVQDVIVAAFRLWLEKYGGTEKENAQRY